MRWFGVSLGEGTSKVGEALTFSLPSPGSCPGASSWCRKRCYAQRYEQRRPACRRAYERNFALSQTSERFAERMIAVLPRIMPCFRIHVGGDFHSEAYVRAWLEICRAFPQTRFWTYTRSWSVPNLLPLLGELRALGNVQVFASTDPTMELPPEGWRVSFLSCDSRAHGMPCRAQGERKTHCLVCGHCFCPGEGNVVFRVH